MPNTLADVKAVPQQETLEARKRSKDTLIWARKTLNSQDGVSLFKERMERDSNPRTSYPVAGFQNRCLRPDSAIHPLNGSPHLIGELALSTEFYPIADFRTRPNRRSKPGNFAAIDPQAKWPETDSEASYFEFQSPDYM